MKALTIWQPWASLIIAGAKPYEFRGWRAPRSLIGQRIVIHAAARKIDMEEVGNLFHMRHFRNCSEDIKLAWAETCLTAEKAQAVFNRALEGGLPHGRRHRHRCALAALQSLFDPEEIFFPEASDLGEVWRCLSPFDLIDGSDVTKREWIGNMVPGDAATGMANTIGESLILADMGESFFLSTREIWAKPGALALSIDNDQAAFRMDGARA
jgi:ASCH domain.